MIPQRPNLLKHTLVTLAGLQFAGCNPPPLQPLSVGDLLSRSPDESVEVIGTLSVGNPPKPSVTPTNKQFGRRPNNPSSYYLSDSKGNTIKLLIPREIGSHSIDDQKTPENFRAANRRIRDARKEFALELRKGIGKRVKVFGSLEGGGFAPRIFNCTPLYNHLGDKRKNPPIPNAGEMSSRNQHK